MDPRPSAAGADDAASWRPQVGQVPSAGIEFGFQNFEQSSHHGISARPASDRRHAVALLDEVPLAAVGRREAPHELVAQASNSTTASTTSSDARRSRSTSSSYSARRCSATNAARSSASSIAAILLANTALTAGSGPITAIFAVGSASVASGRTRARDIA